MSATVASVTPARRTPTLLDAIVWETSKLAAQVRARAVLGFCVIAPIAVVFILKGQQPPPKDTLFGRYIHETGLAVPLLMLGFATQWILPLLTAIVAGDIFASEDNHGTWKTVLTRSASRAQLFWAKWFTAAAFAVAALFLLTASTILSAVLIIGRQPLIGLSGQLIPSGHALRLIVAAWASELAPLLGFTCLAIALSVRTRNPAFGIAAPVVLGLVMELLGAVGGAAALRPLLLTTSFESWHGLLAQPHFYSPLVEGVIVCVAWSAVATGWAFWMLRRRDITGG